MLSLNKKLTLKKEKIFKSSLKLETSPTNFQIRQLLNMVSNQDI